MSCENVEIVRRIYGAFTRRDVVTPFELYAEDIVWDISRMQRAALYDKPIYHGHEGVRETWTESLGVFGEVDLHAREVIDAGDRVFAVVEEHAVGRASEAHVHAKHFAVWSLAGGKVARLQVFDDEQEALRAAGLPGRSG
jgi:ketosteroid isomerase-like protein